MLIHRMKNNTRKKGFTLIEVVVAVAIFTVLMLAVNMLFVSLYRQQGTSAAMIKRTQDMNYLLSTMSRELRESNRGENGNFFIAQAASSTIVFYSDLDDDGLTEKISYALAGTNLKKTVTEPGSGSLYAGAGTVTVVCSEVQNGTTPIFTYYSKSYTGSQAPMILPVSALDVSLVGISFTVNTLSQNKSYPLHVETKVQLRNLQ